MSNQNKPAPARQELAESPVDLTSRGYEIDNKDPNFDYQFCSSDPKHPQFFAKMARPHRIGQEGPMLPGWQFVTDDTDPNLHQGNVRSDQGQGVDTAYRNGSMVLMKTPKKNTQVYRDYVEKQRVERLKSIQHGTQQIGTITVSAGISSSATADLNKTAFGG